MTGPHGAPPPPAPPPAHHPLAVAPPEGLCALSAREQARLVRTRAVSSRELVEAHLDRIAAVNPALNAIVTLDPEAALAGAGEADRALARGAQPGPLHGLPIAIKDVEDVAGMRTTYGSPLFGDHVPDADAPIVTRLRRAGAIVIGKTNTPEFASGSQTFNPVFGATRNPYDLARTPGGSSGGAAAAVAAHLLPLADASDLGGSIRNPAAFCNLVGLRPTPGRVPDPQGRPWDPLPVLGGLARDAADAALFLRAVAGPDPGAPLSLPDPPEAFTPPLPDAGGLRIAWSRDLGGLPVEAEVTAALEPMRARLAAPGCEVEDAEPDLRGADEAFEVLRGIGYAEGFGALLDGGGLKATIVENTRYGLALTGAQVARGLALQAEVFHAMRAFLGRYDVLALPTVQVAPFAVETEWPREVAGVRMGSYIEWMRSCSRISVTGHPAVSVPGAWTPEGLPVGLQLVGRHGAERQLLGLAAALEAQA
jgi:amidase